MTWRKSNPSLRLHRIAFSRGACFSLWRSHWVWLTAQSPRQSRQVAAYLCSLPTCSAAPHSASAPQSRGAAIPVSSNREGPRGLWLQHSVDQSETHNGFRRCIIRSNHACMPIPLAPDTQVPTQCPCLAGSHCRMNHPGHIRRRFQHRPNAARRVSIFESQDRLKAAIAALSLKQ